MDAVAGGELAAAVSRAGGLGMIGGGYGDESWLVRQFALARDSRVGCGFITWSLARQPRLLDTALAHDPAAVMLSFDDPAPFAEKIKRSGTRLVCQIQNRQQAERALQIGADVLVAQGNEADGHGYGPRTTLTLVPEIADLLTQRGSPAVLLAAGGGPGAGSVRGPGGQPLLCRHRSVEYPASTWAGGCRNRGGHLPHRRLRYGAPPPVARRAHHERAAQRIHRPLARQRS